MKKRLLSVLLVGAMAFSLTACGTGAGGESGGSSMQRIMKASRLRSSRLLLTTARPSLRPVLMQAITAQWPISYLCRTTATRSS